MSVMFLAKGTRPDVLKEAVFLAAQCQEPTESDMNKINRVLMHINGTRKK
jgi:hypothetical protein